MASRNQNRPPLSLPRSSSRRKENADEGPTDKRRRIAGKMATPLAHNLRARSVLGALNSGPEMAPQLAAADSSSAEGCGLVFNSREDVELLLSEKMVGKNKTDKAKCEQRMEYIKKLKFCIKWFQGVEDGLNEDKLKLQSTIESLEKQCADLAEEKKEGEEKLTAELDSMKKENDSLRRTLESVESDKLAAIDLHAKEVELRNNIEKSREALTEDLRKAQLELTNFEQHVKNLQDVNERFQIFNNSLERHNAKLESDAIVSAEIASKLQQQKTDLTEALNSSRAHCSSLQNQLSSSKASLEDALKEKEELKSNLEQLRGEIRLMREDRDAQLGIVQSLQSDLGKFRELSAKSSLELGNLSTRNETLEATCSAQRSQIQQLQSQLEAANEKLQLSDSTAMETIAQFENQKRTISELQSRLSFADLQIVEAEKLRKKLHNTILELKGNIRVFCRVRPLNPDDDDNGSETGIISYPSSLESQGRGIDLTHNGQRYPFTFDKVFDQETTQEEVFVEISQLVQSALDGYKVCIFAYGQTGSGKTYTMMGKTGESDKKGLIPRSLEQIFQTSQSLSSQGWKYKMQASMLEIYNETIRDLLSATKAGGSDSISNPAKQYNIKHDQNGNTHVSDLTVVDVCSIREVSYLLDKASQSRSVGKTNMNEQSSRSHFVFTLRIFGVNESTDQQVQGVLNLIDLAGSERLAKSGATGDRLKETQAINKSLSALSDVIFSIAKREDHIPFRNSKLTYLLQPCLGGDAKTLMFVNISPESSSTGETICSLRFAARVNACEVGVPRRHTQQQSRAVDSRLSYG